MNKARKKVVASTILLVLSMLVSTLSILPTSAKNMNIDPSTATVYYINGGGEADIDVLSPLPTNYPPSLQKINFRFIHIEIPNEGVSVDTLRVFLYVKMTGATEWSWQPFAIITTSAEHAALARAFWKGTLMELDATHLTPPLPASFSTDNVKVVDESQLKVERHGNSVSIIFNAPNLQLKRPSGPSVYFTLPPFSMELSKFGGSVHKTSTTVMTGWTDASGYTYIEDKMGFDANGIFTCTGLTTGAVSNAFVSLKTTQTFIPPA